MSSEIRVLIKKSDMISTNQWSKEIKAHGFDLQFDCDLDVFNDNGYVPTIHKGVSCGFEYGLDKLEDTMFSTDENDEISGKDCMVSFSAQFEPAAIASAMITSGVLAKACNGIYWIMDEFYAEADTIEMARESETINI